MRFKLDENLPAVAKRVLAAAGHDVESVLDEGMGGQPDGSVQAAAEREGRALVTFDLDFADVRSSRRVNTQGSSFCAYGPRIVITYPTC